MINAYLRRYGPRSQEMGATASEIVLRCLRRLSALNYEELEDILTTVGEVAGARHETLARKFGT